VLSDLMQSSFAEAVNSQKLSPAAGPRIEPISTGPGEDLKYRAVFEIFPEVELKIVDGLKIERPVAEVTESDVDAMVQNLREQRPRFNEVDRPGAEGDRVTMDFNGLLDGKGFEGSKGEGVAVLLGGGRMLADFERGVTGAKAGDSLTIDVRYPDDYHNKSLAGQTAAFDVQVKKVEEKVLPELDDEFCSEYGVLEGGMEQLRSEVRENMGRELTTNIRTRLKQQLLDRLLEGNPVEVPRGLVDAQVREMQIDAARRIGARDASQIPPPETFQEPARRRVALGILISELIKDRGIELDRARVEERLAELAADYPDPAPVLKAYRENADAMRQVESLVLEEQVIDYLLERAESKDRPMSFKDLMNFGG
jgi:trigger factor